MRVQERFSIAQVQQASASQASASQKVSYAQDVYVDLQRRFRKLNAVRIRASEVHVKTAHHSKPQTLTHAAASPRAAFARRLAMKGTSKRMRLKPLACGNSDDIGHDTESGGNFALPGYILEMKQDLVEDAFEMSDGDTLASPREEAIDVGDLGVDLGAAIASVPLTKELALATTTASSEAWGAVRLGAGASLNRMANAQPAATPRNAASKGGEPDVPRLPLIERMPQHLASDIYWVHRPVYVPTAQLRWEKRDGAQTIVSMRSEFITKVCATGPASEKVQAAASCPERTKGTLASKPKPPETKIRRILHSEALRQGHGL